MASCDCLLVEACAAIHSLLLLAAMKLVPGVSTRKYIRHQGPGMQQPVVTPWGLRPGVTSDPELLTMP